MPWIESVSPSFRARHEEAERGEEAVAELARRLHPQGPRAALARAFGARSLAETERTWRAHLASG